jgi:predicted glycosyltransferase
MPTRDEHPAGPRVLIYSQDGLGLGHMRRTQLVAAQLLERCPTASALTLSDSPLGSFFRLPPRHYYVKLPTLIKAGPGVWHPGRPGQRLADVLSLRRQRILATLDAYRPHLFLVDHMPQGAMGELLPVLEYLAGRSHATRVALGLRDILDAPDVVRDTWTREGAYRALERYYDSILVYGQRDVFDLTTAYGLPAPARERLRYCGYVCSPADSPDAIRIRATRLAGAGRQARLIVALAGGGADGYPLMSALIGAMPSILADCPAIAVLITGPFMPADLRRRLQRQARDLPVSMRASVSEAHGYIAAADLVVAMAGYNTSVEILRSGKPAILIPRPGPSAEQRTRSQLFTARGWVRMIDPDELTADRLATAARAALAGSYVPCGHDLPDLQGLAVAVDQLLALIGAPWQRDLAGPA